MKKEVKRKNWGIFETKMKVTKEYVSAKYSNENNSKFPLEHANAR